MSHTATTMLDESTTKVRQSLLAYVHACSLSFAVDDLVNFDQDEAFFMEGDDYQSGRQGPTPGDYNGK